MKTSDFNYANVNEYFSMGGPYLGKLFFRGKSLSGLFLANNEKISKDNSQVVFSKLVDEHNRIFKIVLFDESSDLFYQSIDSFNVLAIESIINNTIIYHLAFHTDLPEFERMIEFNEDNFKPV
ncbi:MAG: hypothetical protein OCD76_15100 [Reichenbachiella sp.]